MDDAKNSLMRVLIKSAEYWMPILKESKFKEKGTLTPQEFEAAGDHLVHQCPTWHWEKGEESKNKNYLPKEKQFLMTKNVPCFKRVKDVDNHSETLEKVVLDEDGKGGWVDTHHFAKDLGLSDSVVEMKIEDEKKTNEIEEEEIPMIGSGNNEEEEEEDEDEEPIDFEDLKKKLELENDSIKLTNQSINNSINQSINQSTNQSKENKECELESRDNEIITTRTYDLHITYDCYYQTPRLWLFGYDENRLPLTTEQMNEDISQDHLNKTITMEEHPHIISSKMACIHPCRHAEAMKKIIEIMAGNKEEMGVHMYLMIFLKFVQAVIPTIEYDFTQNFVLGK